jgi:hypothetical protein
MFSLFLFATFHSFSPLNLMCFNLPSPWQPQNLINCCSLKWHILKSLTISDHLVYGPLYDGGRTLLGSYLTTGEEHCWVSIDPPGFGTAAENKLELLHHYW